MVRRETVCLLVACLACCVFGCGGRDVDLVEVSGRVTLDGQPPPAAGTIYFSPFERSGENPLRPSQATFASDGYYEAAAFDNASGLVPGKYRVGVHCWQTPPTDSGPPARSHIPDRYTAPVTSGLELTVPSDERAMTWNIELTAAPR